MIYFYKSAYTLKLRMIKEDVGENMVTFIFFFLQSITQNMKKYIWKNTVQLIRRIWRGRCGYHLRFTQCLMMDVFSFAYFIYFVSFYIEMQRPQSSVCLRLIFFLFEQFFNLEFVAFGLLFLLVTLNCGFTNIFNVLNIFPSV